MRATHPRNAVPALACGALGLLASCSGGVSVHTPPIPVIHETEINDYAWSANAIGPLRPGDRLRIRGSITQLGPDLFDGFSFFSAEALDLQFTLSADDPWADLDLCVFDPLTNVFTLCFASAAQPEVGVFTLPAGVDFHLVVESFAGDSAYWLDIAVKPPSSHAAVHGTGDEPRPSAHRERYKVRASEEATQTLPLQPARLIEVDAEGAVRITPLWLLPGS